LSSRNARCLVVAFVVLAALALRLAGVGYGLPYQFHPDESNYVYKAVNFGKGDLNPHNFYHPTLFMYALSPWFGGFTAFGFVSGMWRSLVEFQADYIVNTHHFWLAARVFAACVGAATVFLTYLAGRRRFGFSTGLVAAIVLALAFLHVEHSQYATTDVAVTLFVPAVILLALGIIEKPRPACYVFGGMLAGLAAATKYPGGAVFLPLVVAHLLRAKEGLPKRIRLYGPPIAIAYLVVGFLVGCPYALLDFKTFWQDLRFMMAISAEPWLVGTGEPGWKLYLLKTLGTGEGVLFAAAAVAATVVALFRSNKDRVLAVFPIAYFLYMGTRPFAFDRFLLPVYPAVALLMARLVVGFASRLKRPAWRLAVGAALTALIMARPSVEVFRLAGFRRLEDPRAKAREWIHKNVPGESSVLTDYPIFAAPIEAIGATNPARPGGEIAGGKLDQLTHFARKYGLEGDKRLAPFFRAARAAPRYHVYALKYPTTSDARAPEDMPRSRDFDCAVLADTFREAMSARADDARFAPFVRLFRDVEQNMSLGASFTWSEAAQAFITRHRLEAPKRVDVFLRPESEGKP